MSSILYKNNNQQGENLFNCQFLSFLLEYKECGFRSVKNVNNFWGEEQSYESKHFWIMYPTQCVSFDGCKLTMPTSLEIGPSLEYSLTSLRDKEENILWFFMFDVVLFLKLFFEQTYWIPSFPPSESGLR